MHARNGLKTAHALCVFNLSLRSSPPTTPTAMPPPIPIPRPAWPLSTINISTTRTMIEAMGWSEGDFQRFKEHVMGAAPRLELDTLAGPQVQDARKWALLVDECVRAFPALDDFAGRWPVEFYYTQYTYWRGLRERRKQKGERGAGVPRMESTAAPTDESRGGLKKRKEHPNPGRGEKENVGVGESTNPNPTQTAAASQSSIVPRWAVTQPVERRDGGEASLTARREDGCYLPSQSCPLPSWAFESVPSRQIAGTTPAPASSPPVASSRAETSSTARREDVVSVTDFSSRMTCNTFTPASSPLVPSGRIEGSSTARREDSFPSSPTTFSASALTQPQLKNPGIRSDASSSFNMSAPAPAPSQPRDRRSAPMARREDSFTSSQVTANTSAPASSPLFPARRIERPSKARRENSFASSQITESSTPASSPSLPTGTSSLPRSRRRFPPNKTPNYSFLNARDDLQQVFTAIGVVADHHLRALLRLGAKKREALLRGLTPEYLTYVDKIEIADMLDTHANKTSGRPSKVQLVAIARPPEGLENVLSKHTCKYTHIKKQMRIADDEEYFEIVELIKAEIPRYLDLTKPFEEQENAGIEGLVKSVCKNRPSMRKYADFGLSLCI
ncbi:hypothetical protein DFH09DRAFT_1278817 [Mycena vulgaris]|nr:hypothetical protein DFH09DRAFT_1278817 [Mycena vulgaris]